MDHQYSSGISPPLRNTIARPVAIAMPRSPSHSPAKPMSTHNTAVTADHGETSASAGAKKNPVPTYHDDPARSEISTNRSHRGTVAVGAGSPRMPSGCRPEVGGAIT